MKVLLFGATGTAGSGVLRACLQHPAVTEIRIVARQAIAPSDRRVRVFRHDDFLNYSSVEGAFRGVDASLWCVGISVQQVSEEPEYRRITHDFALAAARVFNHASPGSVFHYLSGDRASADSRFMWARVKAEAERDISLIVPTVCWRPAFIDGGSTQRGPALYRALGPLIRPFRFIRSIYVASDDIGWAMLHAVQEGIRGEIITNARIRDLADRARAARSGPAAV